MSEDNIEQIKKRYNESIEDKVRGFIISVTDYQFLLTQLAESRDELQKMNEGRKAVKAMERIKAIIDCRNRGTKSFGDVLVALDGIFDEYEG